MTLKEKYQAVVDAATQAGAANLQVGMSWGRVQCKCKTNIWTTSKTSRFTSI